MPVMFSGQKNDECCTALLTRCSSKTPKSGCLCSLGLLFHAHMLKLLQQGTEVSGNLLLVPQVSSSLAIFADDTDVD